MDKLDHLKRDFKNGMPINIEWLIEQAEKNNKSEIENKQDWLTIDLTYFKESGKYYSDIENIQVPNNCGFYERREFLNNYIENELPKGYFYVSLDSHVLGFPFMKIPK